MGEDEKKDNPGHDFVTRGECASARRPVRADITTIKKALVGEDLRGGLVKDCTDMKKDIRAMKKSIDDANHKDEKKQEFSRKHRLALYVALIGAFSLIGSKLIELASALI